jgi:hypothetical protein
MEKARSPAVVNYLHSGNAAETGYPARWLACGHEIAVLSEKTKCRIFSISQSG